MIPQFPQFKKLELGDKKDMEKFTSLFPPYSDFNFISLWSWNIKDEMRLSVLNDNLVVHFTDYLTGEPFYSFLGDKEVNKTADTLLDFSVEKELKPKLYLVPEDVSIKLDKTKFRIEEDPDNFDYIYDINLISEYKGATFSDKRNKVNSFFKNFPNIHVEVLDLKNLSTQDDILKMNEEWLEHKIEKNVDFKIKNELLATKNFFQSEMTGIIGVGVFDDKKLVGYSIFEILPDGYAICHFCKADTHFNAIYDYLMKESAKILKSRGCSFLNYEQDLGLPGLRYAKESFRPIRFLKKVICAYK